MALNSFSSERKKSISALELQNNQNNTSIGQVLPSDMRRQLVEKSMSIGSVYLRAGFGTEPPCSIYSGMEHAAEGNRPQPLPERPSENESYRKENKDLKQVVFGLGKSKDTAIFILRSRQHPQGAWDVAIWKFVFKMCFPSQNEAVM